MANSRLRVDKFGDIVDICVRRAKINGAVQTDIRELFQGYVNEYYIRICTERNWHWRKFDRSFVVKPAQTTGTVNVTNGSRTVVFSAIAHNTFMLGKTVQISGTQELYRIIGTNSVSGEAYLEAPYVGTTNAVAGFKLYQYEFALPPDCDTIQMVYVDGQLEFDGQLDYRNVEEFNRLLAMSTGFMSGKPCYYTRDGKAFVNASLPILDVMVLNYDFLGGDDFEKVSAIRVFPIESAQDTLVHLNYAMSVEPMISDTDVPIMPVDDRWVLIHYALYEWWKQNGNDASGDRELRDAEKMLREMRDEYRKTDVKPKMVVNANRFHRDRLYDRDDDEFRAARIAEGSY